MDDIRPAETALLPISAGEQRWYLLELCYKTHTHTYPETYYDLASPALRKGGKYDDTDEVMQEQQKQQRGQQQQQNKDQFLKPEHHRLLRGLLCAVPH